MEKFWNLEAIGVKDSGQVSDDDQALQSFNESVKFENGRYEVRWPWKDEQPDLQTNFALAHGRLQSLVKRISTQPEMLQRYDDTIQEQLRLGIVEKVEENEVKEDGSLLHYLPHHCVIKENHSTTKLRIVYDASAKPRKAEKSLNECLHRGPVILQDLCGLLMRFRLNKIGIVSDIEKAFLQIGLQIPDRDVTRFLWLKDIRNPQLKNNVDTYRFCRVLFGVISSPFLLAATVKHHLQNANSEVAHKLLQEIYVDNVLSGAETIPEAVEFYRDAKTLFSKAAMNLREWSSNSEEFMNQLPESDRVQVNSAKVLGLHWDMLSDTLQVHGPKRTFNDSPTKKTVLQLMSEVFDPLGLIAPLTVRAKMLVQELWIQKFNWEQELPPELRDHWQQLIKELRQISTIKIPRCVITLHTVHLELHCFCDASAKAYAVSIYLRVVTSMNAEVNLVFAKSRLAPLKKLTLPRLELMGALIGVRSLNFVAKELNRVVLRKVIWTDSKCVLWWITSNKLLEVFVENRLKEIRASPNTEFRYVPTAENPADLPTRGLTFDQLVDSTLWWYGPEWLRQEEISWPPAWHKSTIEELEEQNVRKEFRMAEPAMTASPKEAEKGPFDLLPDQFSSLSKVLRVTAWILRFTDKCRKKSAQQGPLCAFEIKQAQLLWELAIQNHHFVSLRPALTSHQKGPDIVQTLNLFLAPDGLIRCSGRFTQSDLSDDAQHPILLPKKSKFTDLVITHYHRQVLHSGVRHTLAAMRQKYWVPQGRAQVVRVLSLCPICRRWEGGPYQIPVAPPLPSVRVKRCVPFLYVGVDYLGPLYVRMGPELQKVWICLYTCAATRAIHLELISDMSAEQFLLCLRRFIAHRGRPECIISDNAKQFKLAKTVLDKLWSQTVTDSDVQNYVADQGIAWRFIVERAPWMGGFYERLVGSVKRALKRAIGTMCLTITQLQTVLAEVETVVNSRPLLYPQIGLDDGPMLTPGHFLQPIRASGVPDAPPADRDPDFAASVISADTLLQSWKRGQRLLNQFWQSWRNDYLLNLREQHSVRNRNLRAALNRVPQVGDPVLIKDNLPRAQWKLGIVDQLVRSHDDLIRAAIVRLPNRKKLQRPIKLLYPIEMSDCVADEQLQGSRDSVLPPDIQVPDPAATSARPTRQAAQRARDWFQQTLLVGECHDES